jgi:hypothetical protein
MRKDGTIIDQMNHDREAGVKPEKGGFMHIKTCQFGNNREPV